METDQTFWRTVPLSEMTREQWESLCDGCGKCCLNKLEDWDTGEIYFTNVACTLFDDETCLCKDYENRFEKVADCIQLHPETVSTYQWLPSTCAYRLVEQEKDLPAWHHLISGSKTAIHQAKASVQFATLSEDGIGPDEYEFHIVDWIDKNPIR